MNTISELLPVIVSDGAAATAITHEQIMQELRHRQRLENFRRICPKEFAKPIDRTLLKNLQAWDAADAWDGSFPGVWIWSQATGRGKTRMLWRKFGALHVKNGREILKSSAQNFAETYFSFHMDGEPRTFYRWVMRFAVVMIDDADKLDVADTRAAKMFRELFDELYSANKPVLVTANEPISFFERKLGASTARRMREVCREIEF